MPFFQIAFTLIIHFLCFILTFPKYKTVELVYIWENVTPVFCIPDLLAPSPAVMWWGADYTPHRLPFPHKAAPKQIRIRAQTPSYRQFTITNQTHMDASALWEEVFGELAYFSSARLRIITVIAASKVKCILLGSQALFYKRQNTVERNGCVWFCRLTWCCCFTEWQWSTMGKRRMPRRIPGKGWTL